MNHKPFSGVMTAIATPFFENGEIDYESFHKLIDFQKKAGIHGIVVLGTTGESPSLNEQESEKLTLAALNHQHKDFHIYVGTGTNNTKSSIEKTIKYSKLKTIEGKSTDGVMVVVPYYNKPNPRCLLQHFTDVSKAVKDTPVCVYNVPGRTGINLLPQTLVDIAKANENIVAIKEAAGNVNAIAEMRNGLNQIGKQNLRILSGDDATFVPSLLAGAEGVISVTSHIIPKTFLQIWEAFQKGDLHTLQKLHLATYCINNGIFSIPNPIGVKWMLSRLGICGTTLRAPLYAPDAKEAEILEGIFTQLKNNHIQLLT